MLEKLKKRTFKEDYKEMYEESDWETSYLIRIMVREGYTTIVMVIMHGIVLMRTV